MEAKALVLARPKQLPGIEARAWTWGLRVEVFGVAEVQVENSLSALSAEKLVKKWLAEGRIKLRADKGPRGTSQRGRNIYEITPAYKEPKDRTSLIAQQMWTAARGLKKFTPIDVLTHCRADLKVDLKEASAYCQALLRGGYLRVVTTAIPGQRDATYQLVRNSGPRAPVEKRVTAIWDPNDAAYAFVSGVGRLERSK